MKYCIRAICVVASLLIIVFSLFSCMGAKSPGTKNTEVSSAPEGQTLMNTRCTVCHNTDRIKAKQVIASRSDWEGIVDRMIKKGAVLTNDQRTVLIDYLSSQK